VTLERAGTAVLLLITVAVLAIVSLSAVLSIASDDLFASVDEARGHVLQTPRSQPAIWLSAHLAADLPSNDIVARRRRADQLAYRSERVREVASVAALTGLLVALLTARPTRDTVRGLDASSPLANTTSNGTV
jgi:hypothetical protein